MKTNPQRPRAPGKKPSDAGVVPPAAGPTGATAPATTGGHSGPSTEETKSAPLPEPLGADSAPAAPDAPAESVSESDDWEPVQEAGGHLAPELAGDEDDDEGQNKSAQLVEEGVKKAEREQILRAAKAASRSEP